VKQDACLPLFRLLIRLRKHSPSLLTRNHLNTRERVPSLAENHSPNLGAVDGMMVVEEDGSVAIAGCSACSASSAAVVVFVDLSSLLLCCFVLVVS